MATATAQIPQIVTEEMMVKSPDAGIEIFVRNKRPANMATFRPERTVLFVHGATYPAHAALRSVYLPLLASHIVLATMALPMVLATFFFSLTGRFPQHRRIARWTFPIWLYVSVTGVVIYFMLYQWFAA